MLDLKKIGATIESMVSRFKNKEKPRAQRRENERLANKREISPEELEYEQSAADREKKAEEVYEMLCRTMFQFGIYLSPEIDWTRIGSNTKVVLRHMSYKDYKEYTAAFDLELKCGKCKQAKGADHKCKEPKKICGDYPKGSPEDAWLCGECPMCEKLKGFNACVVAEGLEHAPDCRICLTKQAEKKEEKKSEYKH